MSNCLFGSRKKESSPESFTFDVGAICFLIGVDSPICPLLDRIPELIGVPWRVALRLVAVELLQVAVDSVTETVPTSPFCEARRPTLPPEITYQDVFEFIASYVPPFSVVASPNALLEKITKYYLFQKWNELCECKPKEPLTSPENIEPIPPFTARCAASAVYQNQINQGIANGNSRNASFSNGILAYFRASLGGGGRVFLTEAEYDNYLPSREAQFNGTYETVGDEVRSGFQESPDINSLGCLSIESIGGNVYSIEQSYRLISNSNGQVLSDGEILGVQRYQPYVVRYDDNVCCPPEPETPIFPPEPENCIPVPPPIFCELFPDSPLCANVPPLNGNGCEPVSIVVADYDCANGASTKTVEWLKE